MGNSASRAVALVGGAAHAGPRRGEFPVEGVGWAALGGGWVFLLSIPYPRRVGCRIPSGRGVEGRGEQERRPSRGGQDNGRKAAPERHGPPVCAPMALVPRVPAAAWGAGGPVSRVGEAGSVRKGASYHFLFYFDDVDAELF